MAFFTIDCMSDGLKSLLFTLEAFLTQNLPLSGINSSHGSALTPWNNSSKDSAWKLPTLIRILSAVLRQILARHIASASPSKVILPSTDSTTSYPRSIISFFSTASRPKWQGAISSIFFIYSFFQLKNYLFTLLQTRSLYHKKEPAIIASSSE